MPECCETLSLMMDSMIKHNEKLKRQLDDANLQVEALRKALTAIEESPCSKHSHQQIAFDALDMKA
jgi:hypothetical protein